MIPIERTHEFSGRYHVLGGALSPIDGIDPEDLRLAELIRRVEEGGIREVVTVLSDHVQTDGTPAVLRGGSDKDNLIGYTVRSWRRHPHLPAGRYFALLVLRKLTLCLG